MMGAMSPAGFRFLIHKLSPTYGFSLQITASCCNLALVFHRILDFKAGPDFYPALFYCVPNRLLVLSPVAVFNPDLYSLYL